MVEEVRGEDVPHVVRDLALLRRLDGRHEHVEVRRRGEVVPFEPQGTTSVQISSQIEFPASPVCCGVVARSKADVGS